IAAGMYVTDVNVGHRQMLLADSFNNLGPVWSPDGKWLAFNSNRSGNYDIWLINPNGQSLKQLTYGGQTPDSPVWSPDSSRMVFIRRSSPQAVLIVDARKQWNEQTPEVLADTPQQIFSPTSWSRDSKHILGTPHGKDGIVLYDLGT